MAHNPIKSINDENICLIASNLTIAYFTPNKLPDGHITEEKVIGVFKRFTTLLSEERAPMKTPNATNQPTKNIQ